VSKNEVDGTIGAFHKRAGGKAITGVRHSFPTDTALFGAFAVVRWCVWSNPCFRRLVV
jgi:hypothetical protein